MVYRPSNQNDWEVFCMSRGRKKGVFAVSGDVVVMPTKAKVLEREGMLIEVALDTVFQQMRIAGNRQRTIDSYQYIFVQFSTTCKLRYVEDITMEALYYYLDVLEVSPATKLIRLKSTKAVLSKFFNNGWIKEKFWNSIHIKIDKEVKKGAKESDIDKLLELIDQTSFVGFRDAGAIKLMYKTGIRIRTLDENNVLDWFDEYAKNSGIEMYKLKKSRVTVSYAIGQLIANSYKNRKTDDTLSIATTALSEILSMIPDDYEILKYVLNVFGEMTYPIDYKYINRFKWFKQLLENNGAAVINRDNSRKDVVICSKKLDYLQYGSVLVLDGTARQTNIIYKEMGFEIKPLKNYHNYEARLKVQHVNIKTTQGSRNGDLAIFNTISEDIKLLRKSNLELNLLLLPDKKDIEKYYKLGAITEEQYAIHFQTVVSDGVNQEESMALNLLNTTGQNELSKYNGLALANLPIRHPDFYKSYAIALYGTEINISLKKGKQKNDGNSSWFESKKVNDIYIGLLLADILQIIHRANIRLLNTKEQCNIYIYSDILTAIQQLEVSLNLDFEKRLLSKTFETDCESYFKEAREKFGNNHELRMGKVSNGFKKWFNRHWDDSEKRIIMEKIAESKYKIHIDDLGGQKGKILILSAF